MWLLSAMISMYVTSKQYVVSTATVPNLKRSLQHHIVYCVKNERTALEEQLRQAESECESATSELRHARQTINSLTAQVDAVGAEVCARITNYGHIC